MKGRAAIGLAGRLACSVALSAFTAGTVAPSIAWAQSCAKSEFESVVEAAAAALRDLNSRNTPGFQDKLRVLREKRGWSAEQFMEQAVSYVQDDRIGEFDTRSGDLLTRINSMGEAGANAKTPDCKLLGELRATMKSLVETQIDKWAYMFTKIERALVD